MPNPSGPDHDDKSTDSVESDADTAVEHAAGANDVTESYRAAEPATEVIAPSERQQQPPAPALQHGERRYTAPGFDA
jgi:hypothetical protein